METVPANQPQNQTTNPLAFSSIEYSPTGVVADREQQARPPLIGASDLWSRADVRAACGRRDVAAVYMALSQAGISQRKIAALTGQSQSEIHEILHGRRVRSVELLEQIADGLGCPRSWWGLSHDIASAGYTAQLGGLVAGAVAGLDAGRPAGAASPTVQVAIVFDTLAAGDRTRSGGW